MEFIICQSGSSRKKVIQVERVSVKDAAAEIGCAQEYLRRQMKSGKWNLGEVVKPSAKGSQHEYFIFRAKLDKFLGKEVT